MYPEDASNSTDYVDKCWVDDDDKAIKDITPAEDHLAETPVESHILSRNEVAAFASHHADPRDKQKTFLEIVGSAIAMRKKSTVPKGWRPLSLRCLQDFICRTFRSRIKTWLIFVV
jgi:hypothetical protein